MTVGTAPTRMRSVRRRVKDRECRRIESHPVPGESSPDCRGRIRPDVSGRCIFHEKQEVDEGITKKSVHHIAHPFRRTPQDNLPEISPVQVTHDTLRGKHGGNPNEENSGVQNPETGLGRHSAPHDRSHVHPQACDEANRRNPK